MANTKNLTKYYITNIFMSKYECMCGVCVSIHIIIIIFITRSNIKKNYYYYYNNGWMDE